MTYINAFTSSVIARIVKARVLDTKTIAAKLGHKGDNMLRMWIAGGNIPPLTRLVDLADAVELSAEDLLLPWLCDQDPANHERYRIIACQLGGEQYAADLLSGADENSSDPWWGTTRKPVSAADIVSRGTGSSG